MSSTGQGCVTLRLAGVRTRLLMLAIVIAIWAFQFLASKAWLGYVAVGPVEWLTRWLVFGRRPTFLRSSPVIAGT